MRWSWVVGVGWVLGEGLYIILVIDVLVESVESIEVTVIVWG